MDQVTLRILAVSDLLLDQAWPDLGVEKGKARRAASSEVALRVIERVRGRADILVILGNLFDRRTVLPKTLDRMASVLDRFPGQVLITPGGMDWFSEDSPYATTDWPERVHIFTSANPASVGVSSGTTLWGRALTSPTAIPTTLAGPGANATGCHVALQQACASPVTSAPDGMPTDTLAGTLSHLLSPDARQTAGVNHTIIGGPRAAPHDAHLTFTGAAVSSNAAAPQDSQAAFIELAQDGAVAKREFVELGSPPLLVHELDVSGLETTSALHAAVARLDDDVPIALIGRVRPGLLLPGIGERGLDGRFNFDALHYDLSPPKAEDKTATAEFQRWVLDQTQSDFEKHQAIALGLQALDPSSYEAGDGPIEVASG